MTHINGRVKQDTSPENSRKLAKICGLGFFKSGMMTSVTKKKVDTYNTATYTIQYNAYILNILPT